LVIAPISDAEMAKLFDIPVDDKDKEKDKEYDEAKTTANVDRNVYRDLDRELMEGATNEVNGGHAEELVTVYDKENPVIAVGMLFPNMSEFRMCFKTYALKKEFDVKTNGLTKRSSMLGA
jgi:ssDNA-specific exonuclease RecJ